MLGFSRVRQRHPSVVPPEPEPVCDPAPEKKRGRPRGSTGKPKPVSVRYPAFLDIRLEDHPEVSPAMWNVLVSLIRTLFLGLLRVVGPLKPEMPGTTLERAFFRELPELFHRFIRELAHWWWSHADRGFLGTTLRCPNCQGNSLGYKGDVQRRVVTLFGAISPSRAYYYCPDCDHGFCPLDRRLGLEEDSFLPSVREVVTWLTSLDPYGKSLEFVAKLLQFSISPRTAWLITQRFAATVKERSDEQLALAFADPANLRLPEPEVAPPDIGVISMDGAMGRIGRPEDELLQTGVSAQPPSVAAPADKPPVPEEPTAAAEEGEPKPAFREIKVALAGHLEPARAQSKKRRGHKKRPREDQNRPSLGLRKYAVHLGKPEVLFQMLLLLVYRLGLHKAKTLLVIADGAHWIWNGVKEHFAALGVEVIEILDYWHAVDHLWELARGLHGRGSRKAKAWVAACKDQLLKGRTSAFFEALNRAVEEARNSSPELLELAKSTLTYFRNNEARIRYNEYLARGFLIGSGATEGACKHLIKERVHRAGMRWSPDGCMSVLRNRTLIKNGDWDAFWQEEAHRRQARYTDLKISLGVAA